MVNLRRAWAIWAYSGLVLVRLKIIFALICQDLTSFLVAVVAGTLLPTLARRDQRLLARNDEDEGEDEEIARLRDTVREWRAEAARKGEPLKLPRMPFMLRNIWTAAMLLFTFLTLTTYFVTTVVQDIVVVSLVGICWAVACWVPFAIIMEVRITEKALLFT